MIITLGKQEINPEGKSSLPREIWSHAKVCKTLVTIFIPVPIEGFEAERGRKAEHLSN